MKIIIGLGNPGKKFEKNRHNIGHMFIDLVGKGSSFSKSFSKGRSFFKTDCFMNDSGRFVAEKVNFFKVKPEDLYVVHDDLDIPSGQYKIQLGVGPKVHNGVNSVEGVLGTKDFWRIRIGIDNRPHFAEASRGKDYVLQDFTKEEVEVLKGVFDAIVKDDSFPR